MARKADVIRGTWIESGHGAITRMLLDKADHDTTIISKGRQYYNASDFPLLTLVNYIIMTHRQPCIPTRYDVERYWNDAASMVTKTKTIVIGMTPPTVTREYLAILDGGIIHEALHSLYTVRGNTVDLDRVHRILAQHWNPQLPYASKHNLFKMLWNIYEDAMIERYGIADWEGARKLLCRVHEDVWELEDRSNFETIDHITCYLRDVIEEWTDRAPLDEYDEWARAWTDFYLAQEITDSDEARDSYDTLALAIRTLNKLHNAAQEATQQVEAPGQGSDEGEQDQGQGGESNGSGEGNQQGETGEGGDTGEKGESKADENSEDSDSKQGQGSGQGSSQGDSDSDETSSEASRSHGSDAEGGDEGGKPQDASEGVCDSSREVQPPPKNLEASKDISDARDTKALEPGDALTKRAQEGNHSNLRRPRAYTEHKDTHPVPDKRASLIERVERYQAEIKPHVAAIKSQLALLLRGQRKTRTVRHLKRGRKISNRTLVNVATQRIPKPFEKKTNRPAEHTAVQIVLDLSGSMATSTPRKMMLTFAEVLGGLGVKWSAMGFKDRDQWTSYTAHDNIEDAKKHQPKATSYTVERELKKEFTRLSACAFPVFHDFEERNDQLTLTKLVQTTTEGGTPLMDGFWEGAKRIRARKEERRMLIVITDGNQSNRSTHLPGPIMRNMYDDLLKEDIDVLFVGYQGTEHINLDFLPEQGHIIVERMEKFSKEVNGWIHRRLKERLSLR